jgi:2-dehydropantoate 2-reductase
MKTLVIGPGVIGATYALQLSQAGQDVSLLVRQGQKAAYEQQGIAIRCKDERSKPAGRVETAYHPVILDELPRQNDYQLIVACVRSNQLDPLLPLLGERAGQADVLFFQNNWWGDAKIRACLPPGRYLFGFSRLVGGWRTGQSIDCVIFNAPGMATMLGETDGTVTPRLKEIADVFRRAGMKPEIHRHILGWLATHYVEYLGPVGAILKAGSTAAFVANSSLVREAIVATREGLSVCRARGIDVGKVAPLNLRLFSLPLAMLVPLGQKQYAAPNIQQFFQENIEHGMAEIADQFYEVLNEGKRLNVSMPCLCGFERYYRGYARPTGGASG